MKRTLALSLVALTANLAHAQSSVTMYGIVDAGVQYLTNADAAGHNQVSLASGSYLPSRFGFVGREDLGGGYAAIFRLENGFNLSNGAVATTTSFFNRFAFVGLDTPVGQVTLGRQGSVQYDKTVFYVQAAESRQVSVGDLCGLQHFTGLRIRPATCGIQYRGAVHGRGGRIRTGRAGYPGAV
jgi:predicted porin